MKILSLAYIVAGLYCLGLLLSLLNGLRKHNLSETYDKLLLKKYAIIIVVIALIATPISFWTSLSHKIPNKSYTVNVTVECNDGMSFDAKGTISFSEDTEYIESDRDGEPLFGTSNGDKIVVYRNFYLTDVDCSNEYRVLVDPDEPINGNKVDATVCYNSNEEVSAVIILPELTDKVLGITLDDKISAYSIGGYIEHGLIFVAALIDIILCFMAISSRKETPENTYKQGNNNL